MAQSQQLDLLEYQSLELPYNRIEGELKDTPRLVRGQNVYVTSGGKLSKRPGTYQVTSSNMVTLRCDRLITVETLETVPYVYEVGSFYNSSTFKWEVWWINLDAGSPAWTQLTALRGVNLSNASHEFVVSRGKVYIKAFPGGSDDKYGSVIMDGTGGAVVVDYWGLAPPTVPVQVTNPASWNTTSAGHSYEILYGWKYTYAWVSRTGQVSCRADLQTNPDLSPSDTGTVLAPTYCPELKVQGHADTTRIPYINVYRTTDGGGTFYFLYQIANTGAGDINFIDKYLASGALGTTLADPLPDINLDTFQIAPSLVSNLPPPTCVPPKVLGTDSIERATPIALYAGRLWYAIGNYLYYSAQEEITEGVPEECFPGGLRGNYYKLPYGVNNVVATNDALYVFTMQMTYRVIGSDRETFNLRPFLNNIGAPTGQPRSATVMGDNVVWLTHDLRLATIVDAGIKILSDPLYTDIPDAITAGGEIQLTHWADLDKDYLIVTSHQLADPTVSKQWVCDMRRTSLQGQSPPFWFPPWSINSTCMNSGRLSRTNATRRLMFAVKESTTTCLTYFDSTGILATDYKPVTGSVGYTWFYDTHLMTIPPGNHVNAINAPTRIPAIHYVEFDRSLFAGDEQPRVYAYFDDFWTDPKDLTVDNDPPRRPQSKSYLTRQWQINQVARRVAFRVQQVNDKRAFEQHNLVVAFNPGGGT
jgi:hypothetical protein